MTQTLDPVTVPHDVGSLFEHDELWAVIVWNDDVNTFENVIEALMDIFGHSHARAEKLAWQVHRTGKAVVGIRPKPEAAAALARLHERKIQATIDPA